jgi:hypothetical protein
MLLVAQVHQDTGDQKSGEDEKQVNAQPAKPEHANYESEEDEKQIDPRMILRDGRRWNPGKIVGTYDGQDCNAPEPVKFFDSHAWSLSSVPAWHIGATSLERRG